MEKQAVNNIEQSLEKEIGKKLLRIADKNLVVRIQNPQNFFNADKGVYSVKICPKTDKRYYILRVYKTKEPTIKQLENIIINNSTDHKFYFMVSEDNHSYKNILGYMLQKYEL